MPGINAIELVKIIRQKLKIDIPIVFVTGQGNEDIAIEALKLGADEYIVKRENYLNRLPHLLLSTHQKYVLTAKRKELSESESKYRILFEDNPQPMWIYDVETLKFLEINKSAISHYGYSKHEFLTSKLVDIRPPEDVESFLKYLNQTSRDKTSRFKTRHVKKSGEII